MGIDAGGEVYSDSSAALEIAQRQGIGKLRHIRTQALWVQEARIEGRLKHHKVLGSRNPADALTKYMASTLLHQHLKTVGLESRGGRAESAPEFNNVVPYTESKINRRVRFNAMIDFHKIPSVGKARSLPTAGALRAHWQRNLDDDNGIIIAQEGHIRNLEGDIGGERSRQ